MGCAVMSGPDSSTRFMIILSGVGAPHMSIFQHLQIVADVLAGLQGPKDPAEAA
jgi:hypothetical protein